MHRGNIHKALSLLSMRKSSLHVIFMLLIFLKLVHGDFLECHGEQQRPKGNTPLILNLQPVESDLSNPTTFNRTLWLKPNLKTKPKRERILVNFGKLGSAETNYELKLQYSKRGMQYSFTKDSEKMMEGQIDLYWLNPESWAGVSLSNSKLELSFRKGEQTMDIQFDGYEMDLVDMVRLNGDMDILVSLNCSEPEDITTTLQPTTTTIFTTEPDITTVYDYDTNVTEEIEEDFTQIPEVNSTDDRTLDTIPQEIREEMNDCLFPFWVWIVIALAVIFIILSVILVIYIFVLHNKIRRLRRFSTNQDALPGGYGQQARDLEFFKPGNHESVLGIAPNPTSASYTQTLKLPPGNHMVPEVYFHTAPRPAEYRRSTSCPYPSPSLNFPAPPSTPPPERQEKVPLYCPNGSVETTRPYSRGSRADRPSLSQRRKRSKECFDADDESSSDN